MNHMQPGQTDAMLIREAEMVAEHYLNEFTHIDLGSKARLVMAIMFEDPGVAERLQKELNCSEEEAHVLWLDTKFWLWFCLETKQAVCPSAALDEGWHTFILFTRDYHNFCDEVLGRFVHHSPHVGDRKPDPEAGKALIAYTCSEVKRLFNAEHLSANWEQIIAAKCHDKCCDPNCKDQGCHGKTTVLHGTRSSNKVQQMKAVIQQPNGEPDPAVVARAKAAPSCEAVYSTDESPLLPLQQLQAAHGDCCEECSGSTNCQD